MEREAERQRKGSKTSVSHSLTHSPPHADKTHAQTADPVAGVRSVLSQDDAPHRTRTRSAPSQSSQEWTRVKNTQARQREQGEKNVTAKH